MRRNPLAQVRAARIRAYAEGTPTPVAFFWDDPELLTVDGDTFEIHFNDMIDDWFGISAAMIVEALIAADGRDVLVHLNSPGGMYTEGLAIHSQFAAYTGNVTMRIAGLAASAASFVMLAGDRIEITPGSLVMVHDAWDYTSGPEDEHLKTANLLGKVSDSIARMYTTKAGGDAAGWRTIMKAETWYADQEAVDAGLVDAVTGDSAAGQTGDADGTAAARQWSGIFARAPKRTGGLVPAPAATIVPSRNAQAAGIPIITIPTPTEPVAKPVAKPAAAALDWATLQKGLKGLQP